MIVAHGGSDHLAGTLSPCCATILVVFGPRFAALIAQDSADAPARCGDFVNQNTLAD
jgi:hypothetical protein